MTESVCDESAWDFARVEEIWRQFSPLTPRGKDAKEARIVFGDRDRIEGLYDETEAAVAALVRLDGPGRDRLTWHLSRVPRLPEALAAGTLAALEAIDVFLVKKFLVHYRAILSLLDDESKTRFALTFESATLASLLDMGGSNEESFFVSDAYDPELALVRKRIHFVDGEIARMRNDAEVAAEREAGLTFHGRSFLIIPGDAARALDLGRGTVRFLVAAHDSTSCIVRILAGAEELLATAEREGLLGQERMLEAAVLARLSIAIGSEAGQMARYESALRDFDLARARAVLIEKLGLSRPKFGTGRLAITKGRLIPCETDCARLSLHYRPLDLELEERAALFFGSNMGGKTVTLQTALCLQILAQAGFFVPAESFETEVHAHLVYAGAPRPGSPELGRDADGLSGFGREVEALEKAWRAAKKGGAFVILDELGRTTSSSEAEALVAAASDAFAGAVGTRCLLATHFRGAEPSPAVVRFRMAGLDRGALRTFASVAGLSQLERIRAINGLMRYELIREDGLHPAPHNMPLGAGDSDALEVAALLGLDDEIVSRARAFHSAKHGPEGDR